VPVGTVRKWREKKTGPRARLIGRSLRFRFGDVRAWFDAQPGS
ncbi:MAG: helix-turn-helix domain-containing protein, partial [Curtobacterium sp.]